VRLILPLALLFTGCHARLKQASRSIDAVRIEVTGDRKPNVRLGQLYVMDPGLGGMMTEAYNLAQLSREAQLEAVVANKVDAAQMNAAFVYGVRETLGVGPPFAAVDDATATISLDVRRWGLEVNGFPAPATFAYQVRVRGMLDGRTFYRTRFRCAGDAGPARWVEAVPFGGRDAERLQGLPAAHVQETFDKAAYSCGRQLAARLRTHAG
jgi:hypothetical protein